MSKSPQSSKPQRDRFIEAARELGCDVDEAAFKARLGQIARQKTKEIPPGSEGGDENHA